MVRAAIADVPILSVRQNVLHHATAIQAKQGTYQSWKDQDQTQKKGNKLHQDTN
jgi:hypothetical protein